jgi:hypothetical protein
MYVARKPTAIGFRMLARDPQPRPRPCQPHALAIAKHLGARIGKKILAGSVGKR